MYLLFTEVMEIIVASHSSQTNKDNALFPQSMKKIARDREV